MHFKKHEYSFYCKDFRKYNYLVTTTNTLLYVFSIEVLIGSLSIKHVKHGKIVGK